MIDYHIEKWFNLYRTAILELKSAAITGRIGHARAEVTTRWETLEQHPKSASPQRTRNEFCNRPCKVSEPSLPSLGNPISNNFVGLDYGRPVSKLRS